ncbi:MAG: hypothetical protein ACYDBY_15610 [Thermoanaerobaculia bacterium]
MTAATAPPCRRAEAALLSGGVPVLPEVASHASSCETCGPLLSGCEEIDALFASLVVPEPPPALSDSLEAIGSTVPARVAVRDTLALLAPDALAVPEPSPALLRRLLAVPAAGPRREANVVEMSRFRRLRSDWRVLVAVAYAACLALVAILGVDPLSAARSGASGMAAAGERAIADAREAAADRLDTVLAAQRKKPLTEQINYKVYRTLAVGKAKTSAWAGILLGRVFGSRVETEAQPASPRSEPDAGSLRSFDRAGTDTPLSRAQRA